MLNISDNRVDKYIDQDRYISFKKLLIPKIAFNLSLWLTAVLGVISIILFMPWTQNINAKGYLTTLNTDQRPQKIESTIAGRITKWYVNEGDTVQAGDTILYLSEIKDDYFDPRLVERTTAQRDVKQASIGAYKQKLEALTKQIMALQEAMALKTASAKNKLIQTRYKMKADSIDYIAAMVSDSIAKLQLKRWEILFNQDLKSRTDLEKMRKQQQETRAKLLAQENKWASSRIALENANIDFNNVRNEYQEKLAKVESDRQSALSAQYDTQANVAKLENQISNYQQRQDFRFILAPQDGFINKALKLGLGETVKEGEAVASIIPTNIKLAAEIYVRPVDVPLMQKGQDVRLEFDGWPTVIFGAGWPGTAFGTFGGKVYAVDNNISENGMYRILIEEIDNIRESWPRQLRVGAGVNAFSLLNEVPVWYEIWRQLNGFPPDFYTVPSEKKKPAKDKK